MWPAAGAAAASGAREAWTPVQGFRRHRLANKCRTAGGRGRFEAHTCKLRPGHVGRGAAVWCHGAHTAATSAPGMRHAANVEQFTGATSVVGISAGISAGPEETVHPKFSAQLCHLHAPIYLPHHECFHKQASRRPCSTAVAPGAGGRCRPPAGRASVWRRPAEGAVTRQHRPSAGH